MTERYRQLSYFKDFNPPTGIISSFQESLENFPSPNGLVKRAVSLARGCGSDLAVTARGTSSTVVNELFDVRLAGLGDEKKAEEAKKLLREICQNNHLQLESLEREIDESALTFASREWNLLVAGIERIVGRKLIRESFLLELEEIYPPEDVHGLNHVLEVEQKAIKVLGIACREAKAREEKIDVNFTVLSLAALAHDVGYIAEERMSLDKFEHQGEGVKIIKRIIGKIPFLSQREKAGVLMLIMTHDDTAYSYPLKSRGGKPFLTERQIKQREGVVEKLGFLSELKILREADSFFATGEVGLKRTIEFSTRKGLPFFADGDNPLRADMWEVSIAGNLRLSSRRAFEDAFTQRGKTLAAVGWLVQEKEIFSRCRKEGIEYYPDPGLITSLLNWHENS